MPIKIWGLLFHLQLYLFYHNCRVCYRVTLYSANQEECAYYSLHLFCEGSHCFWAYARITFTSPDRSVTGSLNRNSPVNFQPCAFCDWLSRDLCTPQWKKNINTSFRSIFCNQCDTELRNYSDIWWEEFSKDLGFTGKLLNLRSLKLRLSCTASQI